MCVTLYVGSMRRCTGERWLAKVRPSRFCDMGSSVPIHQNMTLCGAALNHTEP